jgi:hypothetical protein
MTQDRDAAGGLNYRDRKTGLVVFGIVEIIMGAFCALMIPLMILGMAASSALSEDAASAFNAGSMIPGLLFYVVLATWFVWLGIGSIQARRWARALWLVASWLWLISGVLGLVFVLVMMPDMYAQMIESGQMTQEVVSVVKYVTIGFSVVFYILIPAVFVLFYGSRHTRATCEQRDPQVRWTDQCPLPVLAVSLMAGCCAACLPLMGFYGWAMPVFGFILSGPAGAVVALVVAVLLGYVAWGTYRLNVNAWWCAVALVLVGGVSSAITFARVEWMELYEKMNFSAQQLEMMGQAGPMQMSWMLLSWGLWVVVALVYLLYIKRYFAPTAEQKWGE